jgi:hypothetical protein
MQVTRYEAAKAAFQSALAQFQSTQSSYRQAQVDLQGLMQQQTSLQEKQHQFEAAANAAESEFKELFAKSGFNVTQQVNEAMNKKVANKDMASEVAAALAHIAQAIHDFPFKPEVAALAQDYESTLDAARRKYAEMMLAQALSEVPESLLKAIALQKFMAKSDSRDFKGLLPLEDDLNEITARAMTRMFEAIERVAGQCDPFAEFEAAGMALGGGEGLPTIPRMSPAALHLNRVLNLKQSSR